MKPSQIAQTYLDRISAAVMADDYPSYRFGVALPLHMVTHTANFTVSTEEALRDGFDTFRQLLHSQRITDFIRLVVSAEAMDPELISTRYVTHLIAGSLRVMEPFHSQITLRLIEGNWRAVSITNSLSNSRWPLDVLRQSDSTPPNPDTPKGPYQ